MLQSRHLRGLQQGALRALSAAEEEEGEPKARAHGPIPRGKSLRGRNPRVGKFKGFPPSGGISTPGK